MPSVDELRSRYASFSTAELRELAQRPDALTSDAQLVLNEELSRRTSELSPSLSDDPRPPELSSHTTGKPWHRGWLTVFEAFITLRLLAAILGFFSAGGSVPWEILLLLVLSSAIPITGLVLIARRSRYARPFWLAILGLGAGTFVAVLLTGGFSREDLIDGVWAVVWFFYWLRSERVAKEFPPRKRANQPAA